MSEPQKQINYDSDEAAKQVTVAMWQSRTGHLYEIEHMARYDGCTHWPCDTCGETIARGCIYCDKCLDAREREMYFAMPEADSDCSWFYCLSNETFSDDFDELIDQWEGSEPPMIVNCEPEFAPFFEVGDFMCDVLPEDGEVPSEIEEAAKAFNDAVKAYETPISYIPGKTRVRQELIENALRASITSGGTQ